MSSPDKLKAFDVNEWKKTALSFLQNVEALHPEALVTSMGGGDVPEEPIFLTFEEGYGYCPDAAVGRVLSKYRFIRKLGWGKSSTVWLLLDESKKKNTFVAVKILTALATRRVVGDHSLEYYVFEKVASANPNSPGFQHCLTLQSFIFIQSFQGAHVCFVTDVFSSTLAELQGRNRFTLPIAKRIIKQVLLALDYLHRECGYIHTDVKSDNILVEVPQPVTPRIEQYLRANPATIYGPPLDVSGYSPLVFSWSEPLPYFDLGGSRSFEDISVRLADYSEAVSVDKPPQFGSIQPALLRAPEITLKSPWTSTIDIWTVGCLLFELLTAQRLFFRDTQDFKRDYSEELHLQYIKETLGPFPLSLLQTCEDREKFFDKQGKLLRTSKFQPTSLEDRLRRREAVDENDIPGTTAFLHRCLELDPKLRPSAQELLKDSWLANS